MKKSKENVSDIVYRKVLLFFVSCVWGSLCVCVCGLFQKDFQLFYVNYLLQRHESGVYASYSHQLAGLGQILLQGTDSKLIN